MVTFGTAESDGSHERGIEARVKAREVWKVPILQRVSDLDITESSILTLVQNDTIMLAARRPLRLTEPPRRPIRDT
jgi:hypothetical protein